MAKVEFRTATYSDGRTRMFLTTSDAGFLEFVGATDITNQVPAVVEGIKEQMLVKAIKRLAHLEEMFGDME